MRSPVSRIVATSLSPPQPLPPPPSHKTINLQAPATQHISGEVRGIKNTRFLKRHLFGSKRPSLSKVATFLNFHINNLSILTYFFPFCSHPDSGYRWCSPAPAPCNNNSRDLHFFMNIYFVKQDVAHRLM